MNKKLLAFCMTIIFIMSSFSTAFASSNELKVQFEDEPTITNSSNSITRGPALAVTSVNCWDYGFDYSGNFMLQMVVYGQGTTRMTWDWATKNAIAIDYLGYSPIYGFIYTYNCGKVYTNTSYHLEFSASSVNWPYATSTYERNVQFN